MPTLELKEKIKMLLDYINKRKEKHSILFSFMLMLKSIIALKYATRSIKNKALIRKIDELQEEIKKSLTYETLPDEIKETYIDILNSVKTERDILILASLLQQNLESEDLYT